MARVNEGSHSFTCHLYVYRQVLTEFQNHFTGRLSTAVNAGKNRHGRELSELKRTPMQVSKQLIKSIHTNDISIILFTQENVWPTMAAQNNRRYAHQSTKNTVNFTLRVLRCVTLSVYVVTYPGTTRCGGLCVSGVSKSRQISVSR